MLLAIPFPGQIACAGTVWHEGPSEFSNGTRENVIIGPDGLSIDILNGTVSNDWRNMYPSSAPSARSARTMAYDSAHGEAVLFGGGYNNGTLNDTWTYNPGTNTWMPKNPATAPSRRQDFCMVYDSMHGEVMLFGGFNGSDFFCDTWTYNLSTNNWRSKNPPTAPPARACHVMAYDSVHGVAVMHGGYNHSYLCDTWTYDMGTNTWTDRRPVNSPPARSDGAVAYDPARDKTVLFGGYSSGIFRDDTWTYDLTANNWTNQRPSLAPSPRAGVAMVYDSARGKMILFGRYNFTYSSETWTYDLAANVWTEQNPAASPPARIYFGMVFDSANNKAVMFGGNGDGGYLGDMWTYDLAANKWTSLHPLSSPPARYGHAMVYDSVHREMILFGGRTGDYNLNDTWTYSLSTNSWMNQNPPIAPSARMGHAMVFDSADDEVVLFGGAFYDGQLGDTWTYNLSRNIWTNMSPSSVPSARIYHAMAYDSAHDKVILFGGENADPWLNDTWTYDRSTNNWTEMSPVAAPSARNGHAMAFDGKHAEVVMFGGFDGSDLNDTWTYNFTSNRWTSMNPPIVPRARHHHVIAYDIQNDVSVAFGGFSQSRFLNDTWIFDLGTGTWTNATSSVAPPTRFHSAMDYDGAHGKMVLFGGNWSTYEWVTFQDTWVYEYRTVLLAGTFTSAPHDTGGQAYFGTLSWDADIPPKTSLRFQFRSAGTKEELWRKEFSGPDGTAGSYYDISGQQINPANNGTRWLQYRAFLGTEDIASTPVLHGVTVECNLIHSLTLRSPAGGENWTDMQRISWSAGDPDDDRLLFDIYLIGSTGGPVLIASNLTDHSLEWNCSSTPAGSYKLQVTARDDNTSIPLKVSAISGKFTIYHPPPANHLPHVTLISPPDKSFRAKDTVHLLWLGSDPDNDPLTYTVKYSDRPFSQGAIKTITTTSEFLDLSNLSDNTTYYWTVDASDGKANGTDIPTDIWSFTVRLPPVNIPVRFTSTPITIAWVGKEYAYNLTSVDEDGDIPIYSIVSAPPGITLDPSTGKLRWTPATSDIGNHTIVVQGADGRGSTDRQIFNVTVLEIPVPPVVPPKCAIIHPINGSNVKGTIHVKGTATNGTLPLSVIRIRIDNGTWTAAAGLEKWTFSLNTLKLTRGIHCIEAKAFDANLSSETASVNFTVSNPAPGVSSGGNTWCLPTILIAVVTGIFVLILSRKLRAKGPR